MFPHHWSVVDVIGQCMLYWWAKVMAEIHYAREREMREFRTRILILLLLQQIR